MAKGNRIREFQCNISYFHLSALINFLLNNKFHLTVCLITIIIHLNTFENSFGYILSGFSILQFSIMPANNGRTYIIDGWWPACYPREAWWGLGSSGKTLPHPFLCYWLQRWKRITNDRVTVGGAKERSTTETWKEKLWVTNPLKDTTATQNFCLLPTYFGSNAKGDPEWVFSWRKNLYLIWQRWRKSVMPQSSDAIMKQFWYRVWRAVFSIEL